jgi:hypothetical protein
MRVILRCLTNFYAIHILYLALYSSQVEKYIYNLWTVPQFTACGNIVLTVSVLLLFA